jgi:D-alanyl-D-alanine carboxypeptidase
VPGFQFEQGFANYIPRGKNVTPYNLSYVGPAGALISTSKDMIKWIEALFTPNKVLPSKQLQEMLSFISEKTGQPVQFLKMNDPEAFGLGIRCVFYGMSKNNIAFAYEGMTLGYRALYVYSPSDHILIATTVNSSFDGKRNSLYGFVNQLFASTKRGLISS